MRVLACVMLAGAMAVTTGAPVPKDRLDDAAYYPAAKGARWEYQLEGGKAFAEIVTAVESKPDGSVVVEVSREDAGTVRPDRKVAVTKGGVFWVEQDGRAFDPPVCQLRFPAKAGDRWETAHVERLLGLQGVMTTHGPDRVTVPAGTFVALRVEWDRPNQKKYVMWLAPAAGVVKGMYADRSGLFELTKFTPAKP